VLGRVEVGDRLQDPQAPAGQGPGEGVARLVLQDRVVRAGGIPATAREDGRLALDLHDVGVLGHQPERVVALDLHFRQRRILAQPLVGAEQRLVVAMPLRQDHLTGNLVRDTGAWHGLGDGHAPHHVSQVTPPHPP
jgi:hypothetical protein